VEACYRRRRVIVVEPDWAVRFWAEAECGLEVLLGEIVARL
jgi:hypothetical protein